MKEKKLNSLGFLSAGYVHDFMRFWTLLLNDEERGIWNFEIFQLHSRGREKEMKLRFFYNNPRNFKIHLFSMQLRNISLKTE